MLRDKGKNVFPDKQIESIHIQPLVLSPLRHNSKATVFNPFCKSCVPLTAGGNMELYHVRKSPPSLAVDKEVAFLFSRGVILHLVGTREVVLKDWKEKFEDNEEMRNICGNAGVFVSSHRPLVCLMKSMFCQDATHQWLSMSHLGRRAEYIKMSDWGCSNLKEDPAVPVRFSFIQVKVIQADLREQLGLVHILVDVLPLLQKASFN